MIFNGALRRWKSSVNNTLKAKVTALEQQQEGSFWVIRVGDSPDCHGPDEATARINAGVPPDYQGTLIAVHYEAEPVIKLGDLLLNGSYGLAN